MKNNSKEVDIVQVTPKFAIKFANKVFESGILFSVIIWMYAIYKIFNHPETVTLTFYYSCVLFTVLTATLLGLGLNKLSDDLKVKLSVLFVTIFITVYGFETYLEVSINMQRPEEIAKRMGIKFDIRMPMEVVEELNDSGVTAYPNIYPSFFLESNGFRTNGDSIYPLGGISNIATIMGNESGYYPIIDTDECGFNNPKGLYKKNEVDIVLIGDSFAEGEGVNTRETIGGVLRELGFNAISLGKGNNGPLIELATLKEYAEPIKPKIVLWFYYINDVYNLKNELKSSFIKKYLFENNFTQNLISRQNEIDSVLINYTQLAMNKKIETRKNNNSNIINILELTNLRLMINLIPNYKFPVSLNFKNILKKSRKIINEWGGKMYFVYLPDYNSSRNPSYLLESILPVISDMEIPVIDIHKNVFYPNPDPLSLYPFRMSGHFNAKGYRLIAEAIKNRIEADNYIPINSEK